MDQLTINHNGLDKDLTSSWCDDNVITIVLRIVPTDWGVTDSNQIENLFIKMKKKKSFHFDKFFFTGCAVSCQSDNFRWNQWRKFRQIALQF